MINFGHLRYFWAVAHEGNLTRAARRLRVSQSAVSVQIRELEASLGHALFERTGRSLRLTEAGRVALDHADAIFAIGAELEGQLRGAGRGERLRVGAIATLSRNFQMRFLEPLLGRPGTSVSLISGAGPELFAALSAHDLDVVLSNAPPPRAGESDLRAHLLSSQPLALVGSKRRVRARRSWQELIAEGPLVLPGPRSHLRAEVDALLDRLGAQPPVVAEADDMAMMRVLARADVGFAVLPPIVVKEELAGGRLVEIAVLPDLVEAFYAITARRRFKNPLLTELLRSRTA